MTEASRARRLTVFAAAGVLLSAADTYVIVLALPAMMTDLGISLDQLQRATPIISGFLLGYVVVMPLLGRLSDIAGRRPLLYACLGVFAAGSLVTASAHDLATAVAGRALQGAGGGGMVPVTLALVADLWPAARRGTPLGAVGAAQELGSVAGPLYGALVLSLSTWRTIFWVNIPLCALLGAGILGVSGDRARSIRDAGWGAIALAVLAVATGALAIAAPEALVDSVTLGNLYVPLLGLGWLTPLSAIAIVSAGSWILWRVAAARLARTARAEAISHADWPGAALLALVLSALVVTFSTTDPSREVIAPFGLYVLPAAAVGIALFVVRERRAARPLIDLGMLRRPGAYGALLTNVAVGAALMAALLDVPILARATAYPDSQLGAALVLLRLLVAVPVGAAAGGWLCNRVGNRAVAGAGLLLATAGLTLMSRFSATTLSDPFGPGWLHPSDPVLVACGLGFGLAIAPVNASILAAVRESMHGIASALVVLARVLGMLVGVSVLTAVGLHAFFAATSVLPSASTLCPRTPLNCAAYNTLVTGAIVDELRTVFLGAALCALAAAVFAALFLRGGGGRAAVAHA